MATMNTPVQITARQLITVLRKEAAAFSPDRQLRDVLANIAARDMVSAGHVRIIGGTRQHAA